MWANAKPPANFSEAKRVAKQIFRDHRTTFYCGCKYDKHGKVNLKSCGYTIQQNKRRAHRLEWEHIVPVSLWGKILPCWKEALCCKRNQCYKGRTCCGEIDGRFAEMEADLHNLVPELGDLNAMRSNYSFQALPHIQLGQFGQCEFKLDKEARLVEPQDEIKGIIARAYLYMKAKYGVVLSEKELKTFETWNRDFPPNAWEIEWDKRVARVQGNHNLYISAYQEKIVHE